MWKRTGVFGLFVLLFASYAYAQQPRMTAARTDLNQAKAQLQMARHNKGGHRAKAIGLINSAIAEINAGIRFDRRHNHAVRLTPVTNVDQPHMERAIGHLRDARSNLEAASSDKGGHRRKAIGFVNAAIDEVQRGIAAGE